MTSSLQSNNRLTDAGDGWLTSGLYQGYYIHAADGQLYQPSADGTAMNPTGYYFLNVNLFTMQEPAFGNEFYLSPVSGQYTTTRSAADTGDADCVYVPWQHIVQHLYSHFTDLDIKEAHTFWPSGTTEDQLLTALVAELNTPGTSGGTLAWTNDTEIKTFFLSAARNAWDKYTGDQLSDVISLLQG